MGRQQIPRAGASRRRWSKLAQVFERLLEGVFPPPPGHLDPDRSRQASDSGAVHSGLPPRRKTLLRMNGSVVLAKYALTREAHLKWEVVR